MKYTLTILSIFLSIVVYCQLPIAISHSPMCYDGDNGRLSIIINACQGTTLYNMAGIQQTDYVTNPVSEPYPYYYNLSPGDYTINYLCGLNSVTDTVTIPQPFDIHQIVTYECNTSNPQIQFIQNNNHTTEYVFQTTGGNTVIPISYVYSELDYTTYVDMVPGTYNVIASTSNCEPYTLYEIQLGDTNAVGVDIWYNGQLAPDTIYVSEGQTLNFEGVVINEDTWNWQTMDIETPSSLSFSHVFTNAGTYTFTLNGINEFCSTTDNLTVIVGEVVSVNEINIDIAYIQADGQIKVVSDGEFQYTLYSIDGKVIASGKCFGNVFIDTTELSVGTYLLSVVGSNSVITRKFYTK